MYFDLSIDFTTIILLSAAAAALIYIALPYNLFVRRVARRRKDCESMPAVSDDAPGWPAVSVIVYSQDEADALASLLPVILNQDYPAAFEVIVVNEGDSSDVRNTVEPMQLAYRNLYLTHTPDGARNLSRKKLAITLGVKAARYEVVVLTTVAAIIGSDKWLRAMTSQMVTDPAKHIVLGYAAPVPGDDRARGHRRRIFNYAADSVAWLAPAANRHPYRGTELNLAYRKELFFKNKGFSRSLNLHYGDDDIFISEIATPQNCTVELSHDSIVNFSSYDYSKTFRDIAMRHTFTETFIRRRPRAMMSSGAPALWILLGSAAAAIVMSPMNIAVISAALIIIAAALTTVILAWRGAMTALTLTPLRLTIPFFLLMRPFRSVALIICSRLSHQKKYTWN